MLYSYEVEVDASTAETSPSITVVKVSSGVVSWISFRPRPGHIGLCHARVYYHDLQIAPFNRDGDLHGDFYPIEWTEHIELTAAPYEFKIVAWNEDDTYSHTFDISFDILPKWALIPDAISRALESVVSLLSPRRIFGGSG